MPSCKLMLGNCLERLKEIESESVDSIVCDPPYGIEFLGKTWDSPTKMLGAATGLSGGFQRIERGVHRPDMSKCDGDLFSQWCESWATEALRVLKPGGHLLAFGGTRMWHHLATGIERSGFEIRESIMWIHGQGMPKSKAIPGYEGWKEPSLKPAVEPIVVARKQLRIPGKRPGTTKQASLRENMDEHGVGAYNIDACRIPSGGSHMVAGTVEKRSDASGDDRTASGAGMFAAGSKFTPTNHPGGRFPANVMLDESIIEPWSSYFYVAKPSQGERSAGLEGRNEHPTTKPIKLMRELIRLACPPGGKIVDPFLGSGTTGCAAMLENVDFVGIEMDPEYLALAEARIRHWKKEAQL